jgi:hypothetical protein
MTRKAFTILSVAAVGGWYATSVFSGCSSPPSTIGGTPSGTGSSGSGTFTLNAGASGSSSSGGSTGTTSPDGTCGSTTMNTTKAPADVLILLDNTSSMGYSLTADANCGATANCQSRQAVVMPAVSDVVGNNPNINWGLQLLIASGTERCQVYSKPQVPIGPNSASTIKTQLASVQLGSSTPTAAALASATAYLKTVDDGNDKAILLATDGEPNCKSGSDWSTDDLAGASAAAAEALKAGFPVYVIGIGPSTTNLGQLAQSGGTQKYYPATSPAELTAALAAVAKVVAATCTFKANAAPPDTSLVAVYVDKHLVNKSDSKGWKFDGGDATGATITLTGSYCDDMMSGKTTQVQIVFGCPNVPPPSIIP